jgi:hypothetical protein
MSKASFKASVDGVCSIEVEGDATFVEVVLVKAAPELVMRAVDHIASSRGISKGEATRLLIAEWDKAAKEAGIE